MTSANDRIQTLRGLACILLVGYHVIGDDVRHGLRVDDGWVRWVNDGLAYLRMPLFTFLSGLVYGMRPFRGDSRRFLVGKVRRLLLPLLVVGTLFAVVQELVPGTNSSVQDWRLLHIKPVAHYWFLESLFWVFLAVWWLERQSLLNRKRDLAIWLALTALTYLSVSNFPWLGIGGAAYLAPFFLAGLAVTRFDLLQVLRRPAVLAGLILTALAVGVHLGKPVSNPDRHTLAMLVIGLTLCLLALGTVHKLSTLVKIGYYSYTIYLFHAFFTAATRMFLHHWDVANLQVHMAAGVAAGILGPILLHQIAVKHPCSGLLLLGRTARRPHASKSGGAALCSA